MEPLEDLQSRHRKEQRELQGRITNKKKNATKKTRKGVNNECAELERQLREKQDRELAELNGDDCVNDEPSGGSSDEQEQALDRDDNKALTGTDEPTERIRGTTISHTTEELSPDQNNQSQTQTQPPRKRNRQKDRLARRAAEQQAAAAAAADEAASMTDHRKIEKTYLLSEFQAHGLMENEIRPDGHCLFAAVADQLRERDMPLGSEAAEPGVPPYKVVRKRATDYMQAHADEFAPFMEEPLESYVRKMRDTAEWGGQLELTALATVYGVEIKVVQDGRTETIEPSGAEAQRSQGGGKHTIWLAYYRHGYGLGEHYNSLRRAEG